MGDGDLIIPLRHFVREICILCAQRSRQAEAGKDEGGGQGLEADELDMSFSGRSSFSMKSRKLKSGGPMATPGKEKHLSCPAESSVWWEACIDLARMGSSLRPGSSKRGKPPWLCRSRRCHVDQATVYLSVRAPPQYGPTSDGAARVNQRCASKQS